MTQQTSRGKTALRVVLNTVLTVGGLTVGFFLLLMLIFAHPAEKFAILTLYPATIVLLYLLPNWPLFPFFLLASNDLFFFWLRLLVGSFNNYPQSGTEPGP